MQSEYQQLSNKYRRMCYRTKRNGYGNIITKERFMSLAIELDYHSLYQQWINSGCSQSYLPTVDRIDNTKGYVEGNIQFLTNKDNGYKGTQETRNGRKSVIMTNGDLDIIFKSASDASRYLHCERGSVGHAIRHNITIFKNIVRYA